ncbi:MAG TPA: alpha/beta hydrolase [Parafilimonas sp.]
MAQSSTSDIVYCKPVSGTCVTVSDFDVQYKENVCPPKKPPFDPLDDKCFNDLSALKIHVFYPANQDYNACKLPAVIIFHGGAYNECGSYDNPPVVAISQKLAAKGFVVFDVNYRLGVIADNRKVPVTYEHNPVLKFIAAQQMLAIYRAIQDARGAIRSIIAMQNAGNIFGTSARPYQINVNRIFLAGESAGSLVAMSAEFFGSGLAGQAKIDAVFPNVSTTFTTTSGVNLGPIDPTGVYYADPPTSVSQDYFGKVIAILNCWGALFTPFSSAYYNDPRSFFEGQGYTLPHVISFAGEKDTVFDYREQGIYFSPDVPMPFPLGVTSTDFFETETRCLPHSYTVPDDNGMSGPAISGITIGSQTIYSMLKNPPHPATETPIISELYLDCQMYHGLDDDCLCHGLPNLILNKKKTSCIACTYQSNFGTTATDEDQTYDYITGRAATFFQTIMGLSTSYITTTRFVECPNDRITCTGVTSTSCTDTDECPN